MARLNAGGSAAWLMLLLAAIALVFLSLPLFGLLLRVPWNEAVHRLSQPPVWDALRLSMLAATSAALLSLVFGFPLAWLLARGDFPGRRFLRALVLLPMVLPPVVAGVALLTAFGRRGLIGAPLERLGIQLPYTSAGLILAVTFVAAPFLVISLEAGLSGLDPRLEEAATSLGASPWLVFFSVTLPALRPAIVAGTALAWARALGEFGATITFAGNLAGRTRSLPLAVFDALQHDPDGAVLLGALLLAVSLLVLVSLRGRIFAG
jgi:molybdate transport system permease protein